MTIYEITVVKKEGRTGTVGSKSMKTTTVLPPPKTTAVFPTSRLKASKLKAHTPHVLNVSFLDTDCSGDDEWWLDDDKFAWINRNKKKRKKSNFCQLWCQQHSDVEETDENHELLNKTPIKSAGTSIKGEGSAILSVSKPKGRTRRKL